MKRLFLTAVAFGLAAVLGAFLLASREERTLTSDGRILLNLDFMKNRSVPPRIFAVADFVLSFLPQSMTSLRKEDLIRSAQWRCGPGKLWSHPYGEEALTAFTDAFEKDQPPLTMTGRMMLRENFVAWLCAQMEVNRLLEKFPEIADEPIDALIMGGSPRTGSTHLFSMLCQHPNATCLTFAESTDPLSPVSRGDQILTWRDYRYWKSFVAANLILTIRPLFKYMFKFGPTVPMEEIQLGAVVFGSSIILTQVYLPSYGAWFRATDHTPMEEYVKLLLKVIQYQRRMGMDPKSHGRKMWILKSPQNANQLRPKSIVYPDSKFVFTHREAVPIMESMVDLVSYTVGIFSDPSKVDYKGLSRMWVEHQRWSTVDRLSREEVDKNLKPRSKLMNVRFKEFMADPVGTALAVARHAGLGDSKEARDAFEHFQAMSPQEGSKVFKYDLKSFGISEDDVRRAFEPYEREYLH